MSIRENKVNYNLKKFQIGLKDEQIQAENLIENNDITVLWGKAGCGKTLVAVYTALKMYAEKKVSRIIISRPMVTDEDMGYLPGGIDSKLEPWLQPIYENMHIILGADTYNNLIENKVIDIRPLSYMQGQTFTNAAIVIDEAQNVSHKQMEMILSRLGRKSKMIICGDYRQLKLKGKSGFPFLLELVGKIPGLAGTELTSNHRHPIVEKILELYLSAG